MGETRMMPTQRQARMWGVEECPSCNSSKVATDYSTGDLVCLKCGLVIY